jgi:hypothetical protein
MSSCFRKTNVSLGVVSRCDKISKTNSVHMPFYREDKKSYQKKKFFGLQILESVFCADLDVGESEGAPPASARQGPLGGACRANDPLVRQRHCRLRRAREVRLGVLIAAFSRRRRPASLTARLRRTPARVGARCGPPFSACRFWRETRSSAHAAMALT